ncbi:MAG TPA: EthD family reductase [Thermomicrobiales bacterium]|nr:EthD family reductase [Thermomicrobiales bacterium]
MAAARFLVIWDTPKDPEAFDRHYREIHIPLANRLAGLRSYTVGRNLVAVRGGDPPYIVGELEWDDIASLRAAFASPEGQATAADVNELSANASVRSMIYEVLPSTELD